MFSVIGIFRMKLLSGVLLLLLGQALACPFRVEIISNEHGKTQVIYSFHIYEMTDLKLF